MNGHFAGAKDAEATREQYEHGIQVIDEDKVFRYVVYIAYIPLCLQFSRISTGQFSCLRGHVKAQ
jgi:hypothetical protein